MDLELRRRFFAEELQAVCNFRSPSLVDAFAAVPREQFLAPGPWTVLGDAAEAMGAMIGGPPKHRVTPDADPAHVYHNLAIAIDPARQLFNGQPATLAVYLDLLDLTAGKRALHVGCGLGYYTAVMARAVGSGGRVVAFEVDEPLAREARQNLASMPWVDTRHGDASGPLDGSYDAILINAGVTHPLDTWLDALAPGGRVVLPLTGTIPQMAPTIGKGVTWLLTKEDDLRLAARPVGVVAIYSALGVRDESLNAQLGKALMGGPMQWASVKHLRRDAHEASPSCWLHGPTWCWTKKSEVLGCSSSRVPGSRYHAIVRALLVEDDATIAEFVGRGLREAGFAVDHAVDGEAGLTSALQHPYDVAIVDVMLPKRDGLALIDEIRRRGVATPVLILSARRSVDDRVRGLQAGGDDYLTKPFAFAELLARVQALVRRATRAPEPTTLTIDDVTLDLLSRRVTRGGTVLDLRPREFALLEYLLRNPGRVVSKTMILSHVWEYSFDPQTNIVDVLVSRLREKLDKPFEKKLLHTVRGVGYVLRDTAESGS